MDRRSEVLRRLPLAVITALIVARPLVLGEDPGLLNRLSDPWSLLFGLLWLLVAAGWAAWRAWSGHTTWRGSGVEVGLLAVVVLLGVSAGGAAHYKHPALLVVSEWLVLLAAFCMVRQLARTPGDDRGLLAAILATGVSLSAFAIYQYTVEFPQIRQAYVTNLDALLEDMAAENVVANPQLLQQRLLEDNVFATYAHPNSFAGYLALLFPMAIAWTFACGFIEPASRLKAALAAAGALLLGLALWLTHSRGAMLGSLLVGLAVLLASGRRFLSAHKTIFLIGLAIVLVLTVFLGRTEWAAHGITKFWESSAKRNDYWIATWKMIGAHPWLGVGPGNFGRLYPHYMLPRAFEQIKDPHNFLLEMWATGGLFVLVALVLTLGIFFRRTLPVLLRSPSATGGELPAPPESGPWTRWEFYLGGMLGLVLGFALRAMGQSPDEIVLEGAYSVCRSLFWFAAFALFYSIPWSGVSRPLALTAGVAALLFNLLVSGGIAMPSVAQPLWIMAALALNSLSPAPLSAAPSANWFPRMLPLPVLAGVGLAYFLLLFSPVVRSGDALSEARRHYAHWHGVVLPSWRGVMAEDIRYVGPLLASSSVGPLHPLPILSRMNTDLARLQTMKLQMSVQASKYLERFILDPLERARGADPGNAMAWLELAEWQGELVKVSPTPEPAIQSAIDCARQAHLLDPDNKEPYLCQYNLHVLLADRFVDREKQEYRQAAEAMEAVVERDPTNARLRYQLAETLFLADRPVDGRHHARKARELDAQATRPERELTAEQRGQIQRWLTAQE